MWNQQSLIVFHKVLIFCSKYVSNSFLCEQGLLLDHPIAIVVDLFDQILDGSDIFSSEIFALELRTYFEPFILFEESE